MVYSLASIFDIGISITQAIRSLGGLIASTIYDFIVSIYNIFEILAKADFLDSSFVNQIYAKVGLLLGLFMVFKLSFTLIQSLISPEKLNDKKNGAGAIILRVIVSIVLIGVTPTIFREAFKIQNLLVGNGNSDNIIYKLIVGKGVSNKDDFGMELAKSLFFEFYSDEKDPKYDGGMRMVSSIQTTENGVVNYDKFIQNKNFGSIEYEVTVTKSFSSTAYYLALTNAYGSYYIEFNFLGSCIVGIAVAWLLLSFCIQIAIRVFKLAFLQLIAPIPIISYISDPEGSFKKWVQQCTATFLDLFIRLAIIYFVVYLSKFVFQQLDNAGSNLIISTGLDLEADSGLLTWVKVFLIIGLLMFAKRVPELLKDIFPGSDKFDLGIKSPKKLLSEIPGAKATVGVGAGVALGAAGSAVGGLGHGLVNMKKAWQDNKGTGGKRFGKTLGAGAKGLGLSVVGGVAGGLSGVKNYKGGLGGAYKLGMKNLNAPLKEDIDSWKKHRSDWKEANAEIKERNEFINYGESLYRYIEKKSPSAEKPDESLAYSNSEYIRTWKAKKAAGDARDQAKVALDVARANMQRAYNFGTEVEQKKAQDKLLEVQKDYDKAEKTYEGKEAEHKISQKKYAADYKRESAIKAYKNSLPPKEKPSTDSNEAVTTNSQNTNEGNQPNIVNNPIPNPSPQQENDNQSVSNERPVEEQSSANNSTEHVIPTDSSQSTNEVVNTGENIPDEVEEESATSPRTYESQSILSNENIDKGFAGASQELREEVQRQTNISDEPRKRGILGEIIKSREDNDLSAQAELERERKIQQQQNQELEKARNNIKSGGVNPDTIDNLANERYNAAIDKLNNGGSDNS